MKTGALSLLLLAVGCVLLAERPALAWGLRSDGTWKALHCDGNEWLRPEFDDSSWPDALAPNPATNGTMVGMQWVKLSGALSLWDAGSKDWVCARKAFDLSELPGKATLRVCVDDDYFLYVNGVQIGRNEDCNVSYEGETYDITNRLVRGRNVVAIKAIDCGGEHGVVVVGTFIDAATALSVQAMDAEEHARRREWWLAGIAAAEALALLLLLSLLAHLRRTSSFS